MSKVLTQLLFFSAVLILPLWAQAGTSVPANRRLEEGLAHYAQHDYAGAIKILEQALQEHAQDVRVLFYLGYAYYKHGDFEDARASFDEAYRLNPEFSPLPKAPPTPPVP